MAQQHTELPVVGMTCARCAANVERTLNKKVEGVENASVNFGTETVSLDYDPDRVSLDELATAVWLSIKVSSQ